MEGGDKFLMAAGVTAAVVTAAFVFWGPSGKVIDNRNIKTVLNAIFFSFRKTKKI